MIQLAASSIGFIILYIMIAIAVQVVRHFNSSFGNKKPQSTTYKPLPQKPITKQESKPTNWQNKPPKNLETILTHDSVHDEKRPMSYDVVDNTKVSSTVKIDLEKVESSLAKDDLHVVKVDLEKHFENSTEDAYEIKTITNKIPKYKFNIRDAVIGSIVLERKF